MAKHRVQKKHTARNTAVASAVAVGAAALANPAQAAPVTIPGTPITFEVPGIENIAQGAAVPRLEEWIPALAGQAAPANLGAVVNFPGIPAPVLGSSNGQQIVDIARTKIGAPYVWGAAGPHAFDCSGFTSWVYSQVGKTIPRTSYAQAAAGIQVSRDQLQVGDIVSFYGGASHVGIYSGNGMVIHAINEGTPVAETPLDYMPFNNAVRF